VCFSVDVDVTGMMWAFFTSLVDWLRRLDCSCYNVRHGTLVYSQNWKKNSLTKT